MANYFDKFDPPSPAQTPLPNGANPFDQFDPPSNGRTIARRGGKASSLFDDIPLASTGPAPRGGLFDDIPAVKTSDNFFADFAPQTSPAASVPSASGENFFADFGPSKSGSSIRAMTPQEQSPLGGMIPTAEQLAAALGPQHGNATGDAFVNRLLGAAGHAVTHPLETAGKLYEGAKDIATLPGEVYQGTADLNDPATLDRAIGMGLAITPGAPLGAAAQATREAEALGSRAANAVKRPSTGPSVEDLKTAGDALYDKTFETPINVRPEAVQRLAANVNAAMQEFGYHPDVQGAVAPALNDIKRLAAGNDEVGLPSGMPHDAEVPGAEAAPKAPIEPLTPSPAPAAPQIGSGATLKEIDTARKIAGHATTNIDSSTREAARIVREKIDEFLHDLKPEDVAGNFADANGKTEFLKQAQAAWRTMRKTETIQKVIDDAHITADASGSGGNINNALRQGFARVLKNPKRARDFNAAELAAMKSVTRGASFANAARLVGKLGPSGNGLMLALNAAHAAVSPMSGIPLAVAGHAAKKFADEVTIRRANKVLGQVASGGKDSLVASSPNVIVTKFGVFPRTKAGMYALVGAASGKAALINAHKNRDDPSGVMPDGLARASLGLR